MSSFKNILIMTTLALATAANAIGVNLVKNDASDCPKNWSIIIEKGDQKCCYGDLYNDSNGDPNCCVGQYDDFSFTASQSSCSTPIPFTASDYSSLVSSASAAIASGSSSPATNPAVTTTAASTATGSVISSGATGTTGSSSNGALPIATAHAVIGGGVVIAAALLAL